MNMQAAEQSSGAGTGRREVTRVITALRTTEGEGFPIRRPFPTAELMDIDPFLMLDEVGPVDWPPGGAKGAPDHPHRGFETISYILAGEKVHEDSTGKRELLRAGDVQWMTAGRGIVHSEMPSAAILENGGRVHSFQIWVNLPAAEKWCEPGYQYVPAASLPLGHSDEGGVKARVIAGSAFGVDGAVRTRTPVMLQDWTVSVGGKASLAAPTGHMLAIYVFHGAVVVGGAAQRVGDGELALLSDGASLTLAAAPDASDEARLLLLGGRPIGEPVARYGPFVMNTEPEIAAAIEDYRAGRMGTIARR